MRIIYVAILLLAVAVPVVVFFVFLDIAEFKYELWTCNVRNEYRISCPNSTFSLNEKDCINLGCCWDKGNAACFHSFPSQHSYRVENWKENTTLTQLETKYLDLRPRRAKCPYGNRDAVNLRTSVVSTSQGTILRLYLYLDNTTTNTPGGKDTTPLNSSKFEVTIQGPEYFSVQVNRREEDTLIFSTSLGPTIACDDYWELALKFPDDGAVFGLGGLRLTTQNKLLYNSGHRLGANPFIMILDTEGQAHGILFNNRGPMEFKLLENSNILSVKSRSTVMWDISVFAGPNPASVMEQYTSIDGLRPILPPAWALGVHICRDTNRENGNLVADDAFYFLQNAAEIPYESDCLQEGLLYGLDFSISANMTKITEEFKKTGRKLLLSLPPHYRSPGDEPKELFVCNGTERLQEKFYGLEVSYPDFFNDKWQEKFSCNIGRLPNDTKAILGGFVLQDNWPTSTTTYNTSKDMPVAEDVLSAGTLWWEYLHGKEPHYRLHNEYGLRHAKLVKSCLDVTDLVLSAATHTGIGAEGGCHAHTQADVNATWSNMKIALQTSLGLGLAGIPLSGGGSVCGTMGDYDEELCIRWYLMSSMLPLMRVSSAGPLRDPVNLPSTYSRQVVKSALELRYSLLAYFYSLFYEAKSTGVPVARPMFFEFSTDDWTWTIDEQFMIGPALMASPALYKDTVTVHVYLPNDTIWYHFIGGHQINNKDTGSLVTITSLIKEMVLLLRGGYIVPYQEAKLTVDGTLAGPYNLVVGLRYKDGTCFASGNLYAGSEDSPNNITFTANETELVVNGFCSNCILQNVKIYGLRDTMTSCTIVMPNNGAICTVKEEKGVIEINGLPTELSNSENFTIKWEFQTKDAAT
jgi:alpha-glucosidase (family GH31 glycosyl hydrolase)